MGNKHHEAEDFSTLTQRIQPIQGNHEVYILPVMIRHLAAPKLPLYQAVAHWGAMMGEYFTRQMLSEAFHISERRAGNVMDYLMHERRDYIDFDIQRLDRKEMLTVRGDGFRGRWTLKLRIDAIHPEAIQRRRPAGRPVEVRKKKVSPSTLETSAQALWDQLCQQRSQVCK